MTNLLQNAIMPHLENIKAQNVHKGTNAKNR